MRYAAGFALIALTFVPLASIAAQPPSPRIDSLAVESIGLFDRSTSDQDADLKAESAPRAETVDLLAWPEVQSGRKRFVAVGAAVGMIGGAALALHDARNGLFGYAGALFTLPLGALAGGAVGALAGYLVSLAIYPP